VQCHPDDGSQDTSAAAGSVWEAGGRDIVRVL
jgi:hypothetical protein